MENTETKTFEGITPITLWQPTVLIRWKKFHDNFDLNPTKVLQQLWQSNTGEQEWRDVPEEY